MWTRLLSTSGDSYVSVKHNTSSSRFVSAILNSSSFGLRDWMLMRSILGRALTDKNFSENVYSQWRPQFGFGGCTHFHRFLFFFSLLFGVRRSYSSEIASDLCWCICLENVMTVVGFLSFAAIVCLRVLASSHLKRISRGLAESSRPILETSSISKLSMPISLAMSATSSLSCSLLSTSPEVCSIIPETTKYFLLLHLSVASLHSSFNSILLSAGLIMK